MRLSKLVLTAAIAMAGIIVAPEALAQRNAASAVVIDYQRVVQTSAMGRDMATKLQGVGTQIQQQGQAMASEGQAIEQEQQRLATATRGMTEAQINANATIHPQVTALQQRYQQFQARRQALQGDFQCTQIIALRSFQTTASPIIMSIMQQHGAGIVIDSASVQGFDPQLDITNAVVAQLDQSSRTATVARHAVAECQTSAGAAATH